jgi:chromodomain-helicase-DNA-binding protein 1
MVLDGTMNSPSLNQLSNGHRSPLGNNVMIANDFSSDSENELSEIEDPSIVNKAVSSPEPQEDSVTEEDQPASASASPSSDDDDGASEDGDFDVETPPIPANNLVRAESSMSQDSRSNKRKAVDDQEDFMKNDPELYGLRRSVRLLMSIARSTC